MRDVRARIAITNVELRDESGSLRAVWYGRRGLDGKIRPGMRLFVHGRVAAKRRRGAVTIELNVMHHRVLGEDATFSGEIVPVYPATKDVPTRTIRSMISRNLSRLLEGGRERLPDEIVRTHRLITARKAWHDIHAPKSPSDVAPAAAASSSRSSSPSRWPPRSCVPSASAQGRAIRSMRRRNCWRASRSRCRSG